MAVGRESRCKTALLKKNTRHESLKAMFPPKAGQIVMVFYHFIMLKVLDKARQL
jgi:hypothetical protein